MQMFLLLLQTYLQSWSTCTLFYPMKMVSSVSNSISTGHIYYGIGGCSRECSKYVPRILFKYHRGQLCGNYYFPKHTLAPILLMTE